MLRLVAAAMREFLTEERSAPIGLSTEDQRPRRKRDTCISDNRNLSNKNFISWANIEAAAAFQAAISWES